MPAIVGFPTVVEQAVKDFGPLFKNEPERRHFAEYLTGLLVASRKTVNGITSEFAETTDQSCLNRWLTEVEWDVEEMNTHRLQLLQKDPATRYAQSGVIAIDNVLIDHEGKTIEDVGWFWDHADERHLIAHDYIIANYVCPSLKHYPLEFRRFVKRATIEGQQEEAKKKGAPLPSFKDHNEMVRELVDGVCRHRIPGDFAFDSYFTNAENLNHIEGKGRAYVGDLKFNRKVIHKGQEIKAGELARTISPEERQIVCIGEDSQYYALRQVKIPGVGHPVKLAILWERKNGAEAVKILAANRTYWEISKILRVYRKRWTGTETFHRDGKQHLGMGDCQVRDGQGQTRHMYLVFLAYSLLMRELRQSRAKEWALVKLTTIGEACRAALKETLSKTISWAIEKAITEHWELPRIHHALQLA